MGDGREELTGAKSYLVPLPGRIRTESLGGSGKTSHSWSAIKPPEGTLSAWKCLTCGSVFTHPEADRVPPVLGFCI